MPLPDPPQVTLHDPFWTPRQQTNAQRAIFHQWDMLAASGCIDNFRIAAGEKQGFREGWFFADSDAYKWLDAAARIYSIDPNPRLGALIDAFIALLGRAQDADGYLFTYNQIHFPGVRWVNLQIEHELYCHGHLIEAGISHSTATGADSLLEIARRAADRIVSDFRGGGPERTPGHEEIEIALLRLYRLCGHTPYLELAEQFIEQRGRSPLFALDLLRQNDSVAKRARLVREQRQAYLASHPEHATFQLPPGNPVKKPPGIDLRWKISALSGQYFQQHKPVRRQTTPVGHAVRFGYLQTAIAMLLRHKADPSLQAALEQAWELLVARRMYVTGGIGALPALEGFGRDYELDPEYAYAETCAALACLLWNWEMALLTGQARYSDLFEWQLYNAAAAGMGMGGDTYLYNNPLACRGEVLRRPWYAVPCCPSNLSRTWASLGSYICSVDAVADRPGGVTPPGVTIHQYIGSQISLSLGVPLRIEIESGLPWQGSAAIRLELQAPLEFTLRLRLPSWNAGRARLLLNGDASPAPLGAPALDATASGVDPRLSQFAAIHRTWSPGERVELQFDMDIQLRRAHPRVPGHAGKAALTRGPLVYCLESTDNPGMDLFSDRIEPASLQAEYEPGLLGGVTLLRGKTAQGKPICAIPYALWGNRGPSQMNVWVNV